MSALKSTPTPISQTQHERFTLEQHGYYLCDISVSLSGNIAVSSYNKDGRTFIDLYFGWNTVSEEKLKLFYSREFEKYSHKRQMRYVSFLEPESYLLVTAVGNKIEIINTIDESKVLQSHKADACATCLAVREGNIFVGFEDTQALVVFDYVLNETTKIMLKGISDDDFPIDIAVRKDALFVCTDKYNKALSFRKTDGSILTDYLDTGQVYSAPYCITACEELGLVAVLRGDNGMLVYTFHESKPFSVVDVGSGVNKVRISEEDRMMVSGEMKTGEIKVYELEQLTTISNLQEELQQIQKHLISTNKVQRMKDKVSSQAVEMKAVSDELNQTKQELAKAHTVIERLKKEIEDLRGQKQSVAEPSGFGKFQYDLSLFLTLDIVKNLSTIFDFQPHELEKVESDNIEFIRLLKRKGFISSSNITILTDALRRIGQEGVANKVEASFQRKQTD